MSKLKWTGERLVPSVLNEIAVEHLARYSFCLPFIKQKKVLDLACGEGYGTALMAGIAREVTGVDADESIINHAEKKYSLANVQFINAKAQSLPFAPKSFDVVVSFETLEHLTEHDEMLAEIKRVLKKDGCLVISTPNKEVYSHQGNFSNEFHQKELNKEEFEALVGKYFTNSQFFLQRNMHGSFIYPADHSIGSLHETTGDFSSIKDRNLLAQPSYFVAIASDTQLPVPGSVFFNASDIYEERFHTLKKTLTYRVGNAILSPFKWLQKSLGK